MNYRRIGRYGVKVSEMALGSWLTYGGSYGQEQADACVKKAYDLGINYFDTADVYGAGQTHPGAAEEVLAKSLEDFSRSSYVLATKTFCPVGDGPNDRPSRSRLEPAACRFEEVECHCRERGGREHHR